MGEFKWLVDYLIGFLAGAAPLAAFIIFVAKPWVEKRIEHSIAHEYAKKLADYQASIDQQLARQQEQQEIRQRAALMADLLSSWLKSGATRDELNKLSFEAFLWLPQDIAADLSSTLAHKPNALTVHDLIVKTRQHLLGASDSLQAHKVIIFPETLGTTRHQEQVPLGSGPRAAPP
jgi:hypothetical protein